MKPKICGVAQASNFHHLKRMVKTAERDEADLIEIRIDYLHTPPDLAEIRKMTQLPLIATNRPVWEGGHCQLPENQRVATLLAAADKGFEIVDLERLTRNLKSLTGMVKASGAKPIVSSHDYNFTPPTSKLKLLQSAALKAGGDICKFVATARNVEDNLTCFEFLNKASKRSEVVCFCMGQLGIASRILTPLFGACFTYAAVSRGRESAIGQLTIREMRDIYSLMRL